MGYASKHKKTLKSAVEASISSTISWTFYWLVLQILKSIIRENSVRLDRPLKGNLTETEIELKIEKCAGKFKNSWIESIDSQQPDSHVSLKNSKKRQKFHLQLPLKKKKILDTIVFANCRKKKNIQMTLQLNFTSFNFFLIFN